MNRGHRYRPRRGTQNRSLKLSPISATAEKDRLPDIAALPHAGNINATLKLKILALVAVNFFLLWLLIKIFSQGELWPLLAVPIFTGAWFFYEIGALFSVVVSGLLLVQVPLDKPQTIALAVVTFAVLGILLGWGQRRQRLTHRRVLRSSITDPLTGLGNYGCFRDSLEKEISRVDRYGGAMTLIMFDIDHFKLFNDRYGHEKGNEALKVVASTLKHEMRESDVVARYGGEEFVILLPEDQPAGMETAKRMKEAIARAEVPLDGGTTTGVTVSVGLASYPTVAASKEELVDLVDQLLYASKRRGRNQISTAANKRLAVI
jgi:diguanylate cyclase (GGDEF)-like protein